MGTAPSETVPSIQGWSQNQEVFSVAFSSTSTASGAPRRVGNGHQNALGKRINKPLHVSWLGVAETGKGGLKVVSLPHLSLLDLMQQHVNGETSFASRIPAAKESGKCT